jgi:predicted RNA-binding protein with PIN domain
VRWTITDHAVDRYRERIAPGCDWAEARRRLAAATSRAVRQQQLTADGALLYRADDVLMVVTTGQAYLLGLVWRAWRRRRREP